MLDGTVYHDMVFRAVLLAVGVLELLAPRQFVDFWMDLAAEEPSEVTLRPWVYTVARLEGLVVLAWVARRHWTRMGERW